MTIQWYPGHMAKAKRLAIEKLSMVDIVVELIDARIPQSSRNPVIDEIIGSKRRVIALNKADLADPVATREWVQAFQSQGHAAIAIDAQHQKGIRQLKELIRKEMAPVFEEQEAKGILSKNIRLMILGIPNVGKSTLINRFVGKNQAITGNKPGVTKAQRWLKIDRDFELLDTPGILWPKFEDQTIGMKLAITGAIKDDLLHMDDLALWLLEYLLERQPERLFERYRINAAEIEQMTYPEVLLLMTERMNFGDDFDAFSERMIHHYRKGILGQYTLDEPVGEQTTGEVDEE